MNLDKIKNNSEQFFKSKTQIGNPRKSGSSIISSNSEINTPVKNTVKGNI